MAFSYGKILLPIPVPTCFLFINFPLLILISTSFRYNDDLGGVTLSYSDEKVLSQSALVHPYFPLVRLIVSATLVVFKPRAGARLVGVVNKLSDDFIGLVVMGFINVVVRLPDVRGDIRPRPADCIWASAKDPSHTINVGDSVAFTVIDVKHEGSFVTLAGSLKGSDTGNVAVVGLKGEEQGEKKKKRKKSEGGKDIAVEVEVEAEEESAKKKRRKEKEGKIESKAEDSKKEKEKEKKAKGKKEGKEKKRKKGA